LVRLFYGVEMSDASTTLARPRRRGALDRERILDAALALVDADGLDGFTMRRLGAALGVDPMAVYHHIGGKRAIVLALVERVFAGFDLPPTGGAWDEGVRAWANAYRRLVIAHHGLVLNVLGDPAAVAIAAGHANAPLIGALEGAGLPPDAVQASIIALADYVHGAVLPMAAHTEPPDDAAFEAAFDDGLRVILAGIGHLSEPANGPRTHR
jgi:TetR/AcrR family transcriptional regulator, tetracycline repressor protein